MLFPRILYNLDDCPSDPLTVLVGSATSAPLLLSNTTGLFRSLTFQHVYSSPVLIGNYSTVTIIKTTLWCMKAPTLIFSSFANVKLSDIHLRPSDEGPTTLVGAEATDSLLQISKNSDNTLSVITVQESYFHDLAIPHCQGTFISSGYTRLQTIERCLFSNLSISTKNTQPTPWCLSEDGRFTNSAFKDSEDTMYGFIITGPTVHTLSSFDCKNSSFIHCVRINNPPTRLPLRHPLPSATCSTSIRTDCSTSSQIKPSGTASFTNAEFTGCSSSQGGGGIYIGQSGSTFTLTLNSCSFTSCTTSSEGPGYGGGGVMCDYGAQLSATSCTFTSCSSGGYGGAVYWWVSGSYSNGKVALRSCTFCTNSAPNGPDICIKTSSAPAENPFTDCITYNAKQYTSGYYSSSYVEQSSWLQSSGSSCPLVVYVKPSGGTTSSTCGTSASPCSTLAAAYASSKCESGATILLSSGEHTASAVSKSGTS